MTAERMLQDEDTCASLLYVAAHTLLGNSLEDWEPDAMRLEFKRRGLHIPDVNLDALLAAITLRVNPQFFIDANVFENTVDAFNKLHVDPDHLTQSDPSHIAWAVVEAQRITEDLIDEPLVDLLDYETAAYTAASCQFAGFLCVPTELEFCEERLEEITPCYDEVCSEVKKAWGQVADSEDLTQHAFEESPLGVQLALMAGVRLYVEEKEQLFQAQLSSLA